MIDQGRRHTFEDIGALRQELRRRSFSSAPAGSTGPSRSSFPRAPRPSSPISGSCTPAIATRIWTSNRRRSGSRRLSGTSARSSSSPRQLMRPPCAALGVVDSQLLFDRGGDGSRAAPTTSAALPARLELVIDTDPLCIIHTSGSTGVPKGVVLSHRSTIDFMDWVFARFGFDGSEIIGSLSPFYFDIYTLELYLCLAKGATLVIIPGAKRGLSRHASGVRRGASGQFRLLGAHHHGEHRQSGICCRSWPPPALAQGFLRRRGVPDQVPELLAAPSAPTRYSSISTAPSRSAWTAPTSWSTATWPTMRSFPSAIRAATRTS